MPYVRLVGSLLSAVVAIGVFAAPGRTWAGVPGGIVGNPALAWSDRIGWVNFNPTLGNVQVSDSAVTGYAWSQNYGWINLSPAPYGIVNDGQGNLSGYAWGEGVGWIDFSGVEIDSNGIFLGSAYNSAVGTLRLSCANCSVVTSWRATVSSSTPAPVVASGGGVVSIDPLTLAIEAQVLDQNKTLSLSLRSPAAVAMRLGWDLNVLFSAWEPFQTSTFLRIPTDAVTARQAVTLYAQVQDAQGRISPLTPFTFSLTEREEIPTTEPLKPVDTESFADPLVLAAQAGAANALNIGCHPLLAMTLPSFRAQTVREVRKLQHLLLSFVRRSPRAVAVTGRYDEATSQSVRAFQEAVGIRAVNGLVDRPTLAKINTMVCASRFLEILPAIDR